MHKLLGCMLMVVFSGWLVADDKKDEKIDPAKLVGKWEAKNAKTNLVIEFTAGGKTKTTSARLPQPIEGTYTLTGNKLVTVVASSGQEVRETLTITVLTDTELVGTLEQGREKTFIRVKDKK